MNRSLKIVLPLSAALALTLTMAANAEVVYRIEPLELPANSNAWDLNIKGEVVGTVQGTIST